MRESDGRRSLMKNPWTYRRIASAATTTMLMRSGQHVWQLEATQVVFAFVSPNGSAA
jgi:hypothetical protein